MKTKVYRRVAFGLTLAVFPFLGGCGAEMDHPVSGLMAVALAEPSEPTTTATNTTPATPKPETAEPTAEKPAVAKPYPSEAVAEAPATPPAPAGEPALPPSIKPSSPLAGIVKLAQSGVDEAVMLSYIANSSSTFGLGADEIVYLNDLGMPSTVITSMIEHDNALKQSWSNPATAQPQVAAAPVTEAAPAEQTAVAPSYANPPQPEAVPAEPQPANVTYNNFYDTLSPYGSWVNVEGYGMSWQPSVTVINRGWQPYRDGGRWMYTDAGWYWYSDYTWGWAPFHYGRWYSHSRYGWCWKPGYTWGPSWVSWRYTDSYCGWAPLPPAAHYSTGFGFSYYGSSVGISFGFGLGYNCYTFVPWNRFCNYRPSRYYAPQHQSRQIFNNSTVINNVINGNNNTIINRGVPVERVAAATKTDIKKVAIRDVQGVPSRNARRERLDGDGQTLAVHRPQPPQSSSTLGGSGERRVRSAESTIRDPGDSRSGRTIEPRSLTARPIQKDAPAQVNGRTTFAGENSATRPVATRPQTRNSVTAQSAPSPKPIDVPSTRSVSRPLPTRSTVPPLIVRGSERVSEPAPARPVAPQASAPSPRAQTPSLVVIGRRDTTPAQRQETFVTPQSRNQSTAAPERSAPSRPTAPQGQFSQPQPSAPSVTRNWSPQPVQRQESPMPTRSVQPQYTPRPTYSAPVQRPAPSFTPRPSAPPAQISRPAPAPRPQPSPPAMSAPRSAPPPASRSESSSRPSESRPRGRN